MRTVKVFQSGNSQAIRIPKEFSLNESELYIQKVGDALILTPMHDPWKAMKESLNMFSPDVFWDGREQPDMQERE